LKSTLLFFLPTAPLPTTSTLDAIFDVQVQNNNNKALDGALMIDGTASGSSQLMTQKALTQGAPLRTFTSPR
jgi:hypothetical protein